MSSSISSNLTIAILGPTGGCSLSCLHQALLHGHSVRALARSADKLSSLLQQRSIDPSLIHDKLTIIQGDAKDKKALKQLITGTDVVVFGIGGKPSLSWWLTFVIDDPTVCQDCMFALMEAVNELPIEQRPRRLIFISTTGICKKRDLPLLVVPVYSLLIRQPHRDKERAEAVIQQRVEGVFPSVIIVRPSLLTTGSGVLATGGSVRMGLNEIGYTIAKEDVGRKVFELCGAKGDQYEGQSVLLSN